MTVRFQIREFINGYRISAPRLLYSFLARFRYQRSHPVRRDGKNKSGLNQELTPVHKSPPCVVKRGRKGSEERRMISIFSMFIPYPAFLWVEASVSQGINVAHSSPVLRSMWGNAHTHVSDSGRQKCVGRQKAICPEKGDQVWDFMWDILKHSSLLGTCVCVERWNL